MKYESIITSSQLASFCAELERCDVIGFDTEFVSEDSYRPELCLIQVATADHLAVIDPYRVTDTGPFWELLATPGRTVVAHAAREESRFCFRYTGKPIAGLFDTQLAAGFVGIEYPASLGTLTQRIIGKTLDKGETRTDWRHRPLSADQIRYALQDVTDLLAMREYLQIAIDKRDRDAWVREETDRLQERIIEADTRENWRRVSGSAGLNSRQLEIIKHLWRWREECAKQFDSIPKRVMRDDLLIELARRGSADVQRIRGIRGLERRNLKDQYEKIAAAIQAALNVPDSELPRKAKGTRKAVSAMLSQFLSTSIACISRQHHLSPSIVGNSDDVRDLLGFVLDPRDGDPTPALLQGWRSDIVGPTFRDLLAGRLAIRIADVNEPQPLEFFSVNE